MLLSLTLLSCVGKQSILKNNDEPNQIAIKGIFNEFEVVDIRNNVSTRALHIPDITLPGQSDLVHPELTQAHQDVITKQVKSYFRDGENEYNVKIEVVEGIKEFSANLFNEREYVQFDVQISLANPKTNALKTCSSTAFFEAKSMDANYNFIDKIYLKAMRTAVYKCCEKLQ